MRHNKYVTTASFIHYFKNHPIIFQCPVESHIHRIHIQGMTYHE